MGKYRKLPFGYEMRMGNIVVRPDEKPWVEYIFRQYITGASLKEISDRLREDGTPFDADKQWNKNMVSRILADERYLGTDRYPQIIEHDMYRCNPEDGSTENAAKKMRFPDYTVY